MTIISEPNTLLEINETHSNNFYLVIPRLPPAPYIGSIFNDYTKKTGTIPASGTEEVCSNVNTNQIQREHNLDLTNFRLYISGVSMPNVSVSKTEVPTQFSTMSRSGKISFSDLTTTMMISENFLNYKILLYWLYMIHNPEQYNKLSGRELINNIFTDIYLIITNNHKQKIAEFKFLDAFPINLPNLAFTFTNAEKINIDITWAHSGMMPSDSYVLKYV